MAQEVSCIHVIYLPAYKRIRSVHSDTNTREVENTVALYTQIRQDFQTSNSKSFHHKLRETWATYIAMAGLHCKMEIVIPYLLRIFKYL